MKTISNATHNEIKDILQAIRNGRIFEGDIYARNIVRRAGQIENKINKPINKPINK